MQGNYIGTDVTATVALPNGEDGVTIRESAQSNTIGGTTTAARNVISGNGLNGVNFCCAAFGNVVQGNFIGTDALGTADLGNANDGVRFDGAPNNTVGGLTSVPGAPPGNLISGNDRFGVFMINSSSGIQVQGNLIGTDVTGTAPLGNESHAVFIATGSGNSIIGGTAAAARNVVSGNHAQGVRIDAATGNVVQGNYIGTQANGASPLGNAGHGVVVTVSASNNTIGGVGVTPGMCDGPCNTIAFNGPTGTGFDGVRIFSGTGNGPAPVSPL